jgi:hypothetical protein
MAEELEVEEVRRWEMIQNRCEVTSLSVTKSIRPPSILARLVSAREVLNTSYTSVYFSGCPNLEIW